MVVISVWGRFMQMRSLCILVFIKGAKKKEKKMFLWALVTLHCCRVTKSCGIRCLTVALNIMHIMHKTVFYGSIHRLLSVILNVSGQ